MGSLLDEPEMASVLAELHALSKRQSRSLRVLTIARRFGARLGLPVDMDRPPIRKLLSDKLVALDADKARLFTCYAAP